MKARVDAPSALSAETSKATVIDPPALTAIVGTGNHSDLLVLTVEPSLTRGFGRHPLIP
jgi:hypothetical protein